MIASILPYLLILGYTFTTSAALILLKLGTVNGAPVTYISNRLHFNLGIYVITGIFLYGLSFLIYMFLVAKYDLGYIIPLTTALVYTVIFIASFLIFKETFTVLKIAAIILIIGGLILLNVQK